MRATVAAMQPYFEEPRLAIDVIMLGLDDNEHVAVVRRTRFYESGAVRDRDG